jgi:hypothetical protein
MKRMAIIGGDDGTSKWKISLAISALHILEPDLAGAPWRKRE